MSNRGKRKEAKSLFSSGEDTKSNACLNFLYDQSTGYISGYYLAAELLSGYVVRARRDQDRLVYPICFLFRQSIELQLKLIITRGARLLGKTGDIKLDHNLERLWTGARDLICEMWPNAGRQELDEAGFVILEFHRVDPTSQEFRYWTTKKSRRSLSEIRHINLRILGEKMAPVFELLDGIIMAIDHELDCRAEALNL